VARYPLIEVLEHDVQDVASGDEFVVVTLDLTDWCVAVARTTDGDFVFVEQHRHGVNASTLEPAGGVVDEGETAEEAARRELFEETGYRAAGVTSLGWVHPNPALSGNRTHFFFFDGVVREAEPETSSDERLGVVLFEETEVRAAVRDGRITHALSVLALERCLERLGPLRATEDTR